MGPSCAGAPNPGGGGRGCALGGGSGGRVLRVVPRTAEGGHRATGPGLQPPAPGAVGSLPLLATCRPAGVSSPRPADGPPGPLSWPRPLSSRAHPTTKMSIRLQGVPQGHLWRPQRAHCPPAAHAGPVAASQAGIPIPRADPWAPCSLASSRSSHRAHPRCASSRALSPALRVLIGRDPPHCHIPSPPVGPFTRSLHPEPPPGPSTVSQRPGSRGTRAPGAEPISCVDAGCLRIPGIAARLQGQGRAVTGARRWQLGPEQGRVTGHMAPGGVSVCRGGAHGPDAGRPRPRRGQNLFLPRPPSMTCHCQRVPRSLRGVLPGVSVSRSPLPMGAPALRPRAHPRGLAVTHPPHDPLSKRGHNRRFQGSGR